MQGHSRELFKSLLFGNFLVCSFTLFHTINTGLPPAALFPAHLSSMFHPVVRCRFYIYISLHIHMGIDFSLPMPSRSRVASLTAEVGPEMEPWLCNVTLHGT